MDTPHGGMNAPQPASQDGSSPNESPGMEAASVPLSVGSFSIDDAIAMHLVDCDQCREYTLTARPVPNIPRIGAAKDGHCGSYWQLQLMRARYEGKVNNIVAYTEHGDEAPKGRSLE